MIMSVGEQVSSLAHSAFPRSAHACAALGPLDEALDPTDDELLDACEPGEGLDPPQAKTADAKTVTATLRFIVASPSALDPVTKRAIRAHWDGRRTVTIRRRVQTHVA
jgi:hypothetical protein